MLRIGVVGCGYWGPNLIRNFNSLDDCTVVAVCDRDTARLQHMSRLNPGVDTCTDFSSLLSRKDIEAIVIATPIHLHHVMAKQALESGRHVFIEKPMALSSQECSELVELAEDRNLVLMVGHTFIYSPTVRKIKEIIDHGDLGEIQYIGSRRLNLGLFQTDINVTWDLAPHDISIILYILDKVPTGVNCQGKSHLTAGVEDVINMTLSFSNGVFALIHNSWLDPNKVREMTFVGRRRMLVYDDMQPLEKIRIYDKRVETPPHYDTFAEFQFSYHYGDMYCPYVKQMETLRVECQHFLDCIKNGTQPESNGHEGLKVVRILEAANKSLKNGGGRVPVENGWAPAKGIRAGGQAPSALVDVRQARQAP